MTPQISELDWKLFRKLQALALERFCERALSEIDRLAADTGKGAHERYLTVFKLLQKRDKELSAAFDTPSRSTAWRQLALIRACGLLTEEECDGFSPKTLETV